MEMLKTGPPQSDHGSAVRGRLQHKPMQSAQHTPVAAADLDCGSAGRAGGCSTNP